ncbi:MAG: phosphomannomutase/phosphoglucomutase [Gemmatimonadota bacterium]
MSIPAHVFREYDIRGIVGKDFTPELVRSVGQAYGSVLRETLEGAGKGGRNAVVAVGSDNRPSSPELTNALAGGLEASGVDTRLLGTVPTPTTYWAEKALGTDGVLQVTGSHNPPEWNGIKMTLLGKPFYGKAVQGLRARIVSGQLREGEGRRESVPILDRYREDLVGRFTLERPVKAAVDCGNGTGSVVAVRLLEEIGVEVLPLYCDSDGTFPNHHPDPTVDANLEELIETVRCEKADLGIAFDGDADRIGVVDGEGRIIRGDVLLLLFGLDLLERRGPGQLLVYDVKCSQLLPEIFEKAGGKAIMWKTGHSLIKEKMRETGAPIGGELSGHICFADDYIGSDDALYAACRLSALLSRATTTLAAMTDAFPKYSSTPELRIEVSEEKKVAIVEKAVAHFRQGHEVVDVDGARILFGDGWGLLRASNTQPVLVARFEARTPERLAQIRGEVEGWLADQGVHV